MAVLSVAMWFWVGCSKAFSWKGGMADTRARLATSCIIVWNRKKKQQDPH